MWRKIDELWIMLFFVFIFSFIFMVTAGAEWIKLEVTAYSPQECPNTYTASGKIPQEGFVASNLFPFGTRIEIKGNWYTVEDRVGSNSDVDIFMENHYDAIQWGRQYLDVYVER